MNIQTTSGAATAATANAVPAASIILATADAPATPAAQEVRIPEVDWTKVHKGPWETRNGGQRRNVFNFGGFISLEARNAFYGGGALAT